ncbi:histidine phosphatase family protein [Hansschlegelia zhihuaiae]|nr:histidine phosphatase family protein [Hansschlegelia zhihuaiae]
MARTFGSMHRLTLICAARLRRPVFPGAESLDETAIARIGVADPRLRAADRTWCGPDAMTRRSAAALGLDPTLQQALAEVDYGSWRGRSLDDLATSQPDAVQLWVDDPFSAPHGGETIAHLLNRVGNWLTEIRALRGMSVAVAPASFVKASLIAVLGAPATSFGRVDATALGASQFVADGRRWILRSFNERHLGDKSEHPRR